MEEVIVAPPATPEPTPTFSEVSDKAFDKMNAPEKTEETPEPTPAPVKPVTDKDEGEIDEQTKADLKDGKIIPKHRFDEVLRKMSAYESFGTPEEVAQKLKAIVEKAQETPKPETPAEQSAEDKETREYLLQVAPELAKLPELMKTLEALMKDQKEARESVEAQQSEKHLKIIKSGTEQIKSLATKAGINVKTEKALNMVSVGVTHVLNNDPKLRERFYVDGDVTAVDDAFKDYFETTFPGVQRKAASDILKGKNHQNNLPKAPVTGGAPEETPAKPKTLAEAADVGWERIHAE